MEQGYFIGGEWLRPPGRSMIDVHDPATGGVIAQVPDAEPADVNEAVAAARDAFDREIWWSLGADRRGRVLWKVSELIEKNIDELAELECVNNGNSLAVIRNFALPHVAETFRYFAGWATKISGRSSEMVGGPTQLLGYTLREPVGVVGLITPWNAPLLILGWQLAPALAAGCTCVIKPAEETPLSALRLASLLMEAGVPAGVVNVITGVGHKAGAALASHSNVDKLSFTGSTEVGRLIIAASAGNLKKLSLELGGKSPAIVFNDADLAIAVPGVARAIFSNAGQVCSAASRLFVQRGIYDQFLEELTKFAKGIKLGPGLSADTQMGPLISAKQLERVCGYLKSGAEEGAEILSGGKRPKRSGFFLEPTVLGGVKPGMRVVDEEIFGPVLVAMPFDDPIEALNYSNSTSYGLAASVWTQDVAKAHRIARGFKAGSVGINCHSAVSAGMPRGGYKQSGWGRENGPEGLETFLETKSVFVNLG
jgi:phenylacetaldehyde dehydrogenase